MLVLSRKRGEKIQIGGNITVTVVQVAGDRVRLAFDAPPEVPIHREELLRKLAEADKPPVNQRPIMLSDHSLADCR